MWQYVFLLVRRQPGKYALASSGFLLAACALILLSATTQTTVVQANQIISQSWRSSYDLVVLPPQARIAANGRTGHDGGISIKQYEQVQKLPGVDVAAEAPLSPVAQKVWVGPIQGQLFQDDTGNNALQWYQQGMMCQLTSKLVPQRLLRLASTFQPMKNWDVIL